MSNEQKTQPVPVQLNAEERHSVDRAHLKVQLAAQKVETAKALLQGAEEELKNAQANSQLVIKALKIRHQVGENEKIEFAQEFQFLVIHRFPPPPENPNKGGPTEEEPSKGKGGLKALPGKAEDESSNEEEEVDEEPQAQVAASPITVRRDPGRKVKAKGRRRRKKR